MKKLRYMRHARYNKEGGGVPQEELDRAQKAAPAERYTDIFYAPAYRAIQTALAIVAGLGLKVRIHEPIPSRDGIEKIFELIPEGSYGLLVGHSEVIEKAARIFSGGNISLVYLGYVDFIQDDVGDIAVLPQH